MSNHLGFLSAIYGDYCYQVTMVTQVMMQGVKIENICSTILMVEMNNCCVT